MFSERVVTLNPEDSPRPYVRRIYDIYTLNATPFSVLKMLRRKEERTSFAIIFEDLVRRINHRLPHITLSHENYAAALIFRERYMQLEGVEDQFAELFETFPRLKKAVDRLCATIASMEYTRLTELVRCTELLCILHFGRPEWYWQYWSKIFKYTKPIKFVKETDLLTRKEKKALIRVLRNINKRPRRSSVLKPTRIFYRRRVGELYIQIHYEVNFITVGGRFKRYETTVRCMSVEKHLRIKALIQIIHAQPEMKDQYLQFHPFIRLPNDFFYPRWDASVQLYIHSHRLFIMGHRADFDWEAYLNERRIRLLLPSP